MSPVLEAARRVRRRRHPEMTFARRVRSVRHGGGSQAAYPSRLRASTPVPGTIGRIVDENGFTVPTMRGANMFPGNWSVSDLQSISALDTRSNKLQFARIVIRWSDIQPTNGTSVSSSFISGLDATIANLVAAGNWYCELEIHLNVGAIPGWVPAGGADETDQFCGDPAQTGKGLGKWLTEYLANRYGNPASTATYTKAVMGLGLNEPPVNGTTMNSAAGSIPYLEERQARLFGWMRASGFAPDWIGFMAFSYGHGSPILPYTGTAGKTLPNLASACYTNSVIDFHDYISRSRGYPSNYLEDPNNDSRQGNWSVYAIGNGGPGMGIGNEPVYVSNKTHRMQQEAHVKPYRTFCTDNGLPLMIGEWGTVPIVFAGGLGPQPFTGVTSTGSPDTFTKTAHGLSNGDRVLFSNVTGGTGLAIRTPYYVINATSNTFQIATTAGGSAVDLSSNVTAGTVDIGTVNNLDYGRDKRRVWGSTPCIEAWWIFNVTSNYAQDPWAVKPGGTFTPEFSDHISQAALPALPDEFGYDSFYGPTAGALLTTRSIEIEAGGPWVVQSDRTGHKVSSTGTVYSERPGGAGDDAATYMTTGPAGADVDVSLTVVDKSAASQIGPACRMSTNAFTGIAVLRDAAAGNYKLYDIVAGAYNPLGSTYTGPAGRVTIQVRGTAVTVFVDGVSRITGTTTITAAGKIGIVSYGISTDTTGAHGNDLVAVNP